MFQRSKQDILNSAPTLDLGVVRLGDSLERLERQVGWHGLADSANRNVLRNPKDLATCIIICNDLKTKYTAHIALGATTHKAADATNTISAADASNLATSLTLANELKEELNDHCALAAAHDVGSTTGVGEAAAALAPVDFINTVLADDATDLPTLQTLLAELQVKYRNHTFRGPIQIDELLTINP